MANVLCTFTIPSASQSGRLSGGFLQGSTLNPGDNLCVQVVFPDVNTAPSTLSGVFVFTAAPGVNQASASPFLLPNNNLACLAVQQAIGAIGEGTVLFEFTAIPYSRGRRGSYELTFVAIDSNEGQPIQWSEDPEFDTSS